MYQVLDKQFWDEEAAWIERQAALPSHQRIVGFDSYCWMQFKHCRSDNTSPEATARIRKVIDTK